MNKDCGVMVKCVFECGVILVVILFEVCLMLKMCLCVDVVVSVEEVLVKMKIEVSWLCGLTAAFCVERFFGLKLWYFVYDRVLLRCEVNVVCVWNDGEWSYFVGMEVEIFFRDEAAVVKNEWERVVALVFKEYGVECLFE